MRDRACCRQCLSGATFLHDRSWVLHPMFLSLGFVSCGFLSCCILVVFFERPLFFGQRDPSPAQSIEGEAYARAFEHQHCETRAPPGWIDGDPRHASRPTGPPGGIEGPSRGIPHTAWTTRQRPTGSSGGSVG